MNSVEKAMFSMMPDAAAVLRDELRWRTPKPIEVYWEEDGANGTKGVYTSDEGDILFHLKAKPSEGGEVYHRCYYMPAASIEGGAALAQGFKDRLATEEPAPEPVVSQATEGEATTSKERPADGGDKNVFKGFFQAGKAVMDETETKQGQED